MILSLAGNVLLCYWDVSRERNSSDSDSDSRVPFFLPSISVTFMPCLCYGSYNCCLYEDVKMAWLGLKWLSCVNPIQDTLLKFRINFHEPSSIYYA
mmetsp:Transcript_58811/g.143863  ORF Transcript_58811/g.143863 Transcript_58811/m.143863 type:complete len:96 (+) Transcript_58811:1187-1474(+)